MEAIDIIYEKVDGFIKRIHERDIELNVKAQTVMITETKGKDTWGKTIKESHSLAELIGKEMASYQRIKNGELMVDSLLKQAEEKSEKTLDTTETFIRDLDTRSAIRRRKDDVANELLRYIEMAYSNNVIDEIGLGKKVMTLEEENAKLIEKNANLQKLNDTLAKENETLKKYFPDTHKRKGEIGEVTT